MSKRTVRLTESELKRVITESVKRVLSENFGNGDPLEWKEYAEEINSIIFTYASKYRKLNDKINDCLDDNDTNMSYALEKCEQEMNNLCNKIAYEINKNTRQKLVYTVKEYGTSTIKSDYPMLGELLHFALYNHISIEDAYTQKKNNSTTQNSAHDDIPDNEDDYIDLSSGMELKYAPRINAKMKSLGKMYMRDGSPLRLGTKKDVERWRQHVTK